MFVSDLECESEERLTKHPHCIYEVSKGPEQRLLAIEL